MPGEQSHLSPRKARSPRLSPTERADLADLVRRCPVVNIGGVETALGPLVSNLLETAHLSRSRATLRRLLSRYSVDRRYFY